MIDGDMGATQTAAPRREPLRRDPANGLVAGVCAGIGRHLRIDPLIVRIVFVAAATAGGVGILLYAVAWVLVPVDDSGRRPARAAWAAAPAPRARGDRGRRRDGPRDARLPAHDAGARDLVLRRHRVAGGAAGRGRRAALAPVAAPGGGRRRPSSRRHPRRSAASAREVLSRNGVGATLVIAAGIVFLAATHALTAARDVILAVLVVAVVLGIIFAPWVMRLVRSLAAEREERIRSQERAEMAAHLHDSVLQTLALVQKRADDPRAVAALARRQERELRAWLAGARRATSDRLAAALEAVAGEVERAHGVPVEIVVVGDAPLDGRGEALVAAAREAMVNAAKFGGGSPVDVYAEASDDALQVFVRDRGPGFDPAAVPADRRGVRESIVGRMDAPRRARRDPLGARRRDRGRAHASRGRHDARRHRRRPRALPRRRARRARGPRRARGRGRDASTEAVALVVARAPRRRPARRPHARRRRRGGDPRRAPTQAPDTRFLALSVSDAAEDVIAIIRAGARGYVTKNDRRPTSWLDAIAPRAGRRRRLLAAPGRLRARRLRRARPPAGPDADPELDQLTAREREVLRHIARGYMYKEIALRLGISAKTVEAHVSAVLRKLQLSNRHELSRWAAERRLD